MLSSISILLLLDKKKKRDWELELRGHVGVGMRGEWKRWMGVEEGVCYLGSEERGKGRNWDWGNSGKQLQMSTLQNSSAPWWVLLLPFSFIPPSLIHSLLLSFSSCARSPAASGRCCRSCQLSLAFHLAEGGGDTHNLCLHPDVVVSFVFLNNEVWN